MTTLRSGLAIGAVIALAAGYAASQWAAFTGKAPQYATAVDSPLVKWAALAVLGIATVLAFWKDKEAGD